MKPDFTHLESLSGNKVFLISLGCARNLVDSEVMIGLLLRAGFETCKEIEQADFLIVNTCGFLQSARQEALDTFDSLFSRKKKNAKVIAAGCMVQSHSNQIKDRFPEMHYYLGSGDVDKILEAVLAKDAGETISSAKSFLQMGEIPRTLSTPKHYAYIKIAEGCKKQCAFCIIPKIKGALKSKEEAQVLKEFDILLQSGVKEIILIAQDLGDFGKDRSQRDGLEELLSKMLERKGEFWIRLLYLYPDEITDGIIDLIVKDARLCPYLDMPLQHINDRVLKSMYRKTSRKDIETTLQKIRDKVPHIVIRTSLMVGFPGETEEEFNELVQFVTKAALDNVGVFQYSREEASASHKMEGHLEESVKQNRFDRLLAAQKKAIRKKSRNYIGKKLKVLIEGIHPESPQLVVGRFYGQAPDVDGSVILNEGKLSQGFGSFYDVEITDVHGYDLIGKIIKPSSMQKIESPKVSSLNLL